MKTTTIGIIKSSFILLSLAGASLAHGQANWVGNTQTYYSIPGSPPPVVVGGGSPGNTINMGPPAGTIFPPTLPTLDPDDTSISYGYTLSGTGYWDQADLAQSCAYWAVGSYEVQVEETTTHFKSDGTAVVYSHLRTYATSSEKNFCPAELGNWVWALTVETNECKSTDPNDTCYGEASYWTTVHWWGETLGNDPVAGDLIGTPTDTPLYCSGNQVGDIVEGWSAYSAGMGPGGLDGSGQPCKCRTTYCCDLSPEMYMGGIGHLFQIGITIEPGCSLDPAVAPLFGKTPALPNASYIAGSQNSMTPSGGSFDGSGHFSFTFNVPASDTYSIYASSNLKEWAKIGQVSASTQGTFTDTSAPGFSQRFYIVYEGASACQQVPSDAYGYVSINVPTSGAMIANPFVGDNGMSIGTLLPSVPNGTTVQLWDQTQGAWAALSGPVVGTAPAEAATFSSGSWDNPQLVLLPGTGAFIQPTANTTIKFTGQVLIGATQNNIQPGNNVCSSVLPTPGSVTDLGLTTLADGDSIAKWNGTGYSTYTYHTSGWVPSTPSLNPGESILINSSAGTVWNQTFTLPATSPLAGNAPIIYVADYSANTIDEVTPGGAVITFASGLNNPFGITADSSGNVYVSDDGSGNIYKYTPGGVQSTFATGQGYTHGLAIDSSGNLYGADSSSGNITKFTPAGVQSTFATGFYNPDLMSFDSQGNLYVADYGAGTVVEITPDGIESTVASGLSLLDGVAVDQAGDVFACEGVGYGDILEFPVGGGESTFASGLDNPGQMEFDSSGNLIVSDTDGDIYSFTPGGVRSTLASGFEQPISFVLAALQPQNIYVADYSANTIDQITTGGAVTIASGLNNPFGIAADSSGDVFVSDDGTGNIYKFAPDGVQSIFATAPAYAHGLACDSAGNLYVANSFQDSITKITPDGVQTTFATGLSEPNLMSIDSQGNLFVAGYGANCVYKVTPGGVVSTFASGLRLVDGTAVNGAGDVFVSQGVGLGNILEYAPNGALIGTFASGLDNPGGMAFDYSGDLIVADTDGYIYSYTPAGVRSTLASGLEQPISLTVTAAGGCP